MNEFNFRVANAAPRASVFEIGQNVGDTKTTYIYSYKTKYINGQSTGQKTNVDWDMESSIPSWVSVKYAFSGNDCKVTFTTLQESMGSSDRTHTLVFKQRESGQTISFPIWQKAAKHIISTKYFCVGNPANGNYIYDANTETYETHVDSTMSKITFEVFKSDIYSDGTIKTERMGTTDTFEISEQSPFNGGFSIAPDQTQGTDSMIISTRGGSSGTYFGWFYMRFSYWDIIASNRIDMYQY